MSEPVHLKNQRKLRSLDHIKNQKFGVLLLGEASKEYCFQGDWALCNHRATNDPNVDGSGFASKRNLRSFQGSSINKAPNGPRLYKCLEANQSLVPVQCKGGINIEVRIKK